VDDIADGQTLKLQDILQHGNHLLTQFAWVISRLRSCLQQIPELNRTVDLPQSEPTIVEFDHEFLTD